MFIISLLFLSFLLFFFPNYYFFLFPSLLIRFSFTSSFLLFSPAFSLFLIFGSSPRPPTRTNTLYQFQQCKPKLRKGSFKNLSKNLSRLVDKPHRHHSIKARSRMPTAMTIVVSPTTSMTVVAVLSPSTPTRTPAAVSSSIPTTISAMVVLIMTAEAAYTNPQPR